MPIQVKRTWLLAILVLAPALLLLATGAHALDKPAYDPEVEAVARTMFFELLSPY